MLIENFGEYCKLKGSYEYRLYEEIGDNIVQLYHTYKFISHEGYTAHYLFEAEDNLDKLPLLRSERKRLVQENQNLEGRQERFNEIMAIAKQDSSSIKLGRVQYRRAGTTQLQVSGSKTCCKFEIPLLNINAYLDCRSYVKEYFKAKSSAIVDYTWFFVSDIKRRL